MLKVLLYNGGMKLAGKSGVGRAMEHQRARCRMRGFLIHMIPERTTTLFS